MAGIDKETLALSDFPDELLLLILAYCDVKVAFQLAMTNKKFAQLLSDDTIWKRYFLRDFPFAVFDDTVSAKKNCESRIEIPFIRALWKGVNFMYGLDRRSRWKPYEFFIIEEDFVQASISEFEAMKQSAYKQWLTLKCRSENRQPKSNTPLLIRSVLLSDMELTKALIRLGEDINGRDASGKTVLMHAAMRGEEDVVQLLVRQGAEIDACDQTFLKSYRKASQKTALMLAAEAGHVGVVQQLLDAGANPLQIDAWGYTALGLAREKGQTAIVEILQRAVSSPPVLLSASPRPPVIAAQRANASSSRLN